MHLNQIFSLRHECKAEVVVDIEADDGNVSDWLNVKAGVVMEIADDGNDDVSSGLIVKVDAMVLAGKAGVH